MKILALGLLAAALSAQVNLEAPRFGCALNAKRGEEMRGLRGNLVASRAVDGEVRAIACDANTVAVHRDSIIEVNGEEIVRVEGAALLAVSKGRAVIADIEKRRIVGTNVELPEGVTSLAAADNRITVMNRDGVWIFDQATGALVDFWRGEFELASAMTAAMTDGTALVIQGTAVSRCSAAGCESLFELPARALALTPLSDTWRLAELEGGTRIAISARGFFLLPGGAE